MQRLLEVEWHVLPSRELLGSLSACIASDRVWKLARSSASSTLLWFQDCLPTCRLAPLGKPSGAGVHLLDAGENPPAFPVSLFDVGSRPPRRRMREIPPSFCTSAGATLGSEDRKVFCYLGLYCLIPGFYKTIQNRHTHRHYVPRKAPTASGPKALRTGNPPLSTSQVRIKYGLS